MDAEIIEKLTQRRDGQRAWLKENCPYVFADQKHLDANTPERAYWHYGYQTALGDVLSLVKKFGDESRTGES
jgi:hypothetical protein